MVGLDCTERLKRTGAGLEIRRQATETGRQIIRCLKTACLFIIPLMCGTARCATKHFHFSAMMTTWWWWMRTKHGRMLWNTAGSWRDLVTTGPASKTMTSWAWRTLLTSAMSEKRSTESPPLIRFEDEWEMCERNLNLKTIFYLSNQQN